MLTTDISMTFTNLIYFNNFSGLEITLLKLSVISRFSKTMETLNMRQRNWPK